MESSWKQMNIRNSDKWIFHCLVTVEKKDEDKSLRLCIDPKELNENISDEHTHIPTLDELSSKLSQMKYFTVLDLKDGFWHVKLSAESQKIMNSCHSIR